jgi:oxalate decarboxylase
MDIWPDISAIPAIIKLARKLLHAFRFSDPREEKPMATTSQKSRARAVPNRPTPTFGNPDLPPQGRLNTAGNPESLRSDGPHNEAIESQFPSQTDPPATDISTQPFFWSSFNISPKRIQNGGWAHELTSEDFTISDEIAGVNMHLAPGGIRELHWHQTAEWAVMTRGKCRITTIDTEGRPSIEDVEEGDLWFFPAGLPHSLQGLGPTGAEFVLAFDSGKQSESNTLLVTDWIAHTPPDVLAKNFGVPKEVFRNIPLSNLWIFQGTEPGDLAADRAAAGVRPGAEPVFFRLSRSKPIKENSGGRIQVADSTNFKISRTMAAALVTVEPGGMREMHWHPNADEWQYYLRGQARMTVFNTGPKATTNDFRPGDVGVIRKNLGHYVENTGSDVMQFLEVFRTHRYEEVSLADWFSHLPPDLLMQHLNLTREDLEKLPKGRRGIVPV